MTKKELDTVFTMIYGNLQSMKHIKAVSIDDGTDDVEVSVFGYDDVKTKYKALKNVRMLINKENNKVKIY